jgi:hypothetical protein
VAVARHTLDQLRLALRALGSGEREPGAIDRDSQRIDVLVGIGRAIEPRGVNNQRPRRRFVAYYLTSHAELNASLRHLEADAVVARRGAEMHAVVEAVTENGNPAFARRAAGHQRCWRFPIRLRGVKFTECCHDICSHSAPPRSNKLPGAAIETACHA